MASMGSFFKRKKQSNSPDNKISEEISFETLKQLIPIRNLSDDKLRSYALENKAEVLSAGEIIFSINEVSDTAIYLLKGVVSLSDGRSSEFETNATDEKAKFPLSSGIKHTTTATAKSDVSILRVSKKIMSLNSKAQHAFELEIPGQLNQNRILQLFSQYFDEGELDIPSLPAIAINLRQAMEKEVGVDEVVQIVQLDPVISAKLIDVANCPLYVTVVPTKSCFDAVKKVGVNATRSLVTSLSIKNIFKSDSVKIKVLLNDLWKNSLQLSSLSYVLAAESKQKKPEEALLAGLVCDIGAIPFFNFIANLPAEYYNEEEIKQALPIVKPVVGASILKNWGFAEEFIQVALFSHDWYQDTEESLSYTDIVVLSRLHSKIGKKELAGIPPITSIPAASKLKNFELSPENSLRILHDAHDKINDTLRTFSV
jgi:HD-like signal output (HDOD) protein